VFLPVRLREHRGFEEVVSLSFLRRFDESGVAVLLVVFVDCEGRSLVGDSAVDAVVRRAEERLLVSDSRVREKPLGLGRQLPGEEEVVDRRLARVVCRPHLVDRGRT